MTHFPLQTALNLESATRIRFTALSMRMWGRELHFSCVAESLAFNLNFLDCREMRWQIYTHLQDDNNPAFPPTELANFKLGRNQHRSPAHLLTEHFGLSLVYGALELHHDDKIIQLGISGKPL
ncbi:MAG: hypothetical protein Phog2KO_28010 [Phototrophicaceae bacterium]